MIARVLALFLMAVNATAAAAEEFPNRHVD
jgi:hypothetical protein